MSHPRGKPYTISIHSPSFPLCQPQTTTNLLFFAFIGLSTLDVSCKWTRTVCGLSWLSSFPLVVIRVHPCGNTSWGFIPFHGQIIFHAWIRHPLFIYSSWMGTWVVSAFWLLWIMLPWTVTCMFLCYFLDHNNCILKLLPLCWCTVSKQTAYQLTRFCQASSQRILKEYWRAVKHKTLLLLELAANI